ncbi:MAG: hypothetical protein ACM3ZB_12060 [bacterium]
MKRATIVLTLASLWLIPATALAQHGAPAEGAHQEAAAHEAGHGDGADQMTFWKWINFGIMAAVFAYVAYKKGGAFFRGRTESILRDLETSAKMQKEAELRCAEIEQRLAAVGAEIEALRRRAREESAAEGERVREETQREMDKIRKQAEQDIAAAAKAATQELREHAAKLAVALAEQKIRAELTPEVDAELVAAVAADLGRKPAQQAVVS